MTQSEQKTNRQRTRRMTLIPLFTVLMIVSAKLVIPIPFLPLSFQLIIAVMSGLLLGPKWASLAQLLYVAMGLVGLPVFAAGGGPGYLLMPSFGYVLGFVLAALVSGVLRARQEKPQADDHLSYARIYLIGSAGLIACYMVGTTYMFILALVHTGIDATPAAYLATLFVSTLPYIGKDLVLLLLFSELARRLWRFRIVARRV